MIMSNTKQYQLYRGGATVDKYGQKTKKNYTPVKLVEVSTSLYSETNVNNPNYSDVTYIGIYLGENIFQEGDKLGSEFIVLKIIPCGRWTRLMLKEV